MKMIQYAECVLHVGTVAGFRIKRCEGKRQSRYFFQGPHRPPGGTYFNFSCGSEINFISAIDQVINSGPSSNSVRLGFPKQHKRIATDDLAASVLVAENRFLLRRIDIIHGCCSLFK